jgi:hypothetical protein
MPFFKFVVSVGFTLKDIISIGFVVAVGISKEFWRR